MGLGGNPYGPAGTGKTESVKALGGLFGRQVLVFNCDEVRGGHLLTSNLPVYIAYCYCVYCTHTNTHSLTHTHTHTLSLTHTHTHSLSLSHTHTHSHTLTGHRC